MKRFIFSIAVVTTFFLGLGSLVERTGANFRSDEKALDLLNKARIAIGGDSAIASVKSFRIAGTMTHNVKVNGVDEARSGDMEFAVMLPDKAMRIMKLGAGQGEAKDMQIEKQVDVVVVADDKQAMKVRVDGSAPGEKKIVIRDGNGNEKVYTGAEADKIAAADAMSGNAKGDKKIIIKHPDGSTKEFTGAEAERIAGDNGGVKVWKTDDGKTIVMDEKHEIGAGRGAMRQNDLLHLTLGLLLSAPQGLDVEYTYGGEGDLDGTAANIVVASFAGQTYKLFLDRSSNMPVGMTFTEMMPKMVRFDAKAPEAADGQKKDVMIFRSHGGPVGDAQEVTVKFSDYRNVGGLMVPFRWTHLGAMAGTFDVTAFEINPANIAEKFSDQKVMVRKIDHP